MEYIRIGQIVNTHGIKGEIRIKSNFVYKDRIFHVKKHLYIGDQKQKEQIKSYRIHKDFDMLTFDGYDNINQVLSFLKQDVYCLREDLDLAEDEILDADCIGFSIWCMEEELGIIVEVFASSPYQKVIRFEHFGKVYLVPYVKSLIKKIDLPNKKMILYSMEGVIECESIF